MESFDELKNKYICFEYSLFNELFLVLRKTCIVPVQTYRRHLMWHGIDICAELFRRQIERDPHSTRLLFRPSRQFLLSWLVYLIEKIHSNPYEFVSGLCDARCYSVSEIIVDRYLFDKISIGPQMPPPTRLRLQKKPLTLSKRKFYYPYLPGI